MGLFWEINGTRADLRLTGPSGHLQMVPLKLSIARQKGGGFEPIEISRTYEERKLPRDPEVANVARLYAAMAEDIVTGRRTAPNFGDAVALHRIISEIEASAEQVELLGSRRRSWQATNARRRPV
jgi:predicted dehydrogenase